MCHILENEEVVAVPEGDIGTIALLQEVERQKSGARKEGGEDFRVIANLLEMAGMVIPTATASVMRIELP